jgi:hypothetical protein
MLMQEFVMRFSAQNEKSSLFEALRRISHLDSRALAASTTSPDPTQSPVVWNEWPPMTCPGL